MAELTSGWFKVKIPINGLVMRHVSIYAIRKDAFASNQFVSMETLLFRQMPIRTIGEGAFNGLVNLKTLTFDHVKIHTFEENILQPTTSLNSFTLDNCGPQALSMDNLFGASALNSLNFVAIENCNLNDTITERTFTGLVNITDLRLISNSIERIGEHSFDIVLNTLNFLYLGWNNLKSLPIDLFKLLNKNIRINLDQNPWHCNRTLEHLRLSIKNNGEIFSNAIKCHAPPKFAGKLLSACTPFSLGTELIVDNLLQIPATASESPKSPNTQLHFMPMEIQTNETFTIRCELANSNEIKNISLAKSSDDDMPTVRAQNKQLFFGSRDNDAIFELIGFKHKLSNVNIQVLRCLPESNINVRQNIQSRHLNDANSEHVELSNDEHASIFRKVTIKTNLAPNCMYRFCSINLESINVRPWDCAPYYASHIGVVSETWILKVDRVKMIVAFALTGICGVIIGIIIAVFFANIFPKFIRDHSLDDVSSAVSNEHQTNTGRDNV